MISKSAAVGRELQHFVRRQVWIRDPKDPQADARADRMKALVGTIAIPVHAIVDSENNLLSETVYDPRGTADDYAEWLRAARLKYHPQFKE